MSRLIRLLVNQVELPFLVADAEVYERLSESFLIKLTLHYKNQLEDFSVYLDKSAVLLIKDRYFHGVVRDVEVISKPVASYYTCIVHIVPWFDLLKKVRGYQTFCDQSIVEVTKQLLLEQAMRDFSIAQLLVDYPRIFYLARYDESVFYFLSRLWQDAGIFYYYAHSSSVSQLVLLDDNVKFPQLCDFVIPEHDVLSIEQKLVNDGVTLGDHHFLQSDDLMLSSAVAKNNPLFLSDYYYFPGGFAQLSEGQRLAQVESERLRVARITMKARSQCVQLYPGLNLVKLDHYITGIRHYAMDYSHINSQEIDRPRHYYNIFWAKPNDLPYRSPRCFIKPRCAGVETALVVGPAEDDIYTDEYARVKVSFQWQGNKNSNQYRSNWIRTLQAWAGKEVGVQFLPRVGQTALIRYIAGDPDRPIVTGVLSAADKAVFTNHPEINGIRTYGSPDGVVGNALLLDDQDKNMQFVTQKDFSHFVGGNDQWIIGGSYLETIEQGNLQVRVADGDYQLSAKQSIEYRVGDNYIRLEGDTLIIAAKRILLNCAD